MLATAHSSLPSESDLLLRLATTGAALASSLGAEQWQAASALDDDVRSLVEEAAEAVSLGLIDAVALQQALSLLRTSYDGALARLGNTKGEQGARLSGLNQSRQAAAAYRATASSGAAL